MAEMTTEGRHPLADLDRVIHSPARLMVMTYLYVVQSADFVFLMRLTNLTWGNLSTHLSKLEEVGYITLEKGYKGKKPNTTVYLTDEGRAAFQTYKEQMQTVLNELPE
ncbi:MAG: transcriptional regulator [Anaerolineales bacterium]|nr:transcriptional regulator [Anaerolineales bacterium]